MPRVDIPAPSSDAEAGLPRSAAQRVHELLAVLYFLLLPLTEAPKDIAFALLFAWSVARLRWTWRSYIVLRRDRLLWLGVAWAGWTALSVTWSASAAQGFDELGAMRALGTPLVIWAVRDALPRFIVAALVGVAGANVVQLLQQLHLFGLEPNEDGRLDGLMHAIKTGAWCAAAICWHLAHSLLSERPIRRVCLAGLCAAAIGLVATGSRGPWIAAAAAAPFGLVLIAVRNGESRRRAAMLAAMAIVAAAALWPALGDRVVSRISTAWQEARQAQEQHRIATSAGLRIAQWSWAWSIFLQHPFRGVGAGGFVDAQDQLPSFQRAARDHPEDVDYIRRDHPHSTYLQVLACNGVIGGGLLTGLLATTWIRLWRASRDQPILSGSLLALMSWIVGAAFDCYNLNGHHLGMLGLVLAAAMSVPLAQRLDGGGRVASAAPPRAA